MKIKIVYTLLLCFVVTTSIAQLCQGSLGDPIINITFGAGTDPGAPIPAAATGYQYVTSDCPNDGFYTVRGRSSACFDNSWHSITADHTGNGNGYFMLVNAAFQPSAFYLDTIRGLCGSTTYEFAAWIMNVTHQESCSNNPIQPNLTFTIERTDGTILQSYNTNNIPSLPAPTWKQYGFFFTSPATIPDIVVRIINNASGGCGNDLALDDITFRPCGPLISPSIANQTANNVSLCEGAAGSFNFSCSVSGGFANPAYQWQQSSNNGAWTDIPGQNTVSLNRNFPGNTAIGSYAFRLAVSEGGNLGSLQCRIISAPLTVNIKANPVTTATNNGPGCVGNSVILTATGGILYEWTGPNGFNGNGSPLSIDQITAAESGKYYVLVKNTDGCQHLDSTIVATNPAPVATTTFTEAKICPGDSISLNATGGLLYEWQPTTGLSNATIPDPKASPENSVSYKVIVSNALNCTDTAFVNVTVLAAPVANAGPDQSMLENEPASLMGTVSGDHINYAWSASPYINNTMLLSPEVNPPVDTKFILNVNSLDGCGSSSDTVKVFVYKQVFVPNAFSPNGDTQNDTWNIPALNAYRNFELFVYNRYGQMVFHLKNENKPWDGTFNKKKLPVGTYVYLINLSKYLPVLKGTVMIIR